MVAKNILYAENIVNSRHDTAKEEVGDVFQKSNHFMSLSCRPQGVHVNNNNYRRSASLLAQVCANHNAYISPFFQLSHLAMMADYSVINDQ
tara:strand:- start:390349 stop:390621 length:273 start_codon:yes stop_codon:yes gene_type:complete